MVTVSSLRGVKELEAEVRKHIIVYFHHYCCSYYDYIYDHGIHYSCYYILLQYYYILLHTITYCYWYYYWYCYWSYGCDYLYIFIVSMMRFPGRIGEKNTPPPLGAQHQSMCPGLLHCDVGWGLPGDH